MGMFDTVYVDPRILEDNKICCLKCKKIPAEFQTKDFENLMDSYYFSYDDNRVSKLYKLDEPSDKRFWHKYTEEEIAEMKEDVKKSKLTKGLTEYWIEVGGRWEKEAYLPDNRKKRNMGELPHQICRFYDMCKPCHISEKKYDPKAWVEIEVKFTDGIAVSIKQTERIK